MTMGLSMRVDDIFIIWPHNKQYFIIFVEKINSMHSTIKFTTEWSHKSFLFLDSKVTLNEQGRLVMELYTKPTHASILHQQSCHPHHCKTTSAYSQALYFQ